jgi:hypothetical protein
MWRGGDTREIQYIKVGDEVLSRDEVTGEQAYRRVVNTFIHDDKAILNVTIDAAGNMTPVAQSVAEWDSKEYRAILRWRDTISVTTEHPFWVNDVGWVSAGSLQPGQEVEICYDLNTEDINLPIGWDRLYEKRLSGERWTAKVVDVQPTERYRKVYNLEVEEFHTYFVSGLGVWVHNTKNVFADGATPPIALEKSTPNTKPVVVFKRESSPSGGIAGEYEIIDAMAEHGLNITHLKEEPAKEHEINGAHGAPYLRRKCDAPQS